MIFSGLGFIVPGVLALGLVIFVHELGHFLMAKWRGVRVLRFSLGFGPKVVGFTRGETEYQLSWIPLGGYVQMAGDSPDEDGGMPGGRDEFLSHPWFGRVLIGAAGPATNLITAFVLLVVVGLIGVTIPDSPSFVGVVADSSVAHAMGLREGDRIVDVAGKPTRTWEEIGDRITAVPNDQAIDVGFTRGSDRLTRRLEPQDRGPFFSSLRVPTRPAVVAVVATRMPAYKAGVKEGDRIVAVAGKPITTWEELPLSLRGQVDRPVPLVVERDGRRIEIIVTPISYSGHGTSDGVIGIEPVSRATHAGERHGLIKALELGARGTVDLVGSVYAGMWLTVSRPLYYREYVGGPMFIIQAAQQQARRGWGWYLGFVAMINVAIMAFNLLPLPVLDGGHILLAVIEAIRRQAVSARAYVRFQKVGLAVLGTLLVIILANDPLQLVKRHRAIDKQSTPTERQVAPAHP